MATLVSAVILTLFWTPGLRLLRLWRRTGEAPEGMLSGFFLCMGAGTAVALGRRQLLLPQIPRLHHVIVDGIVRAPRGRLDPARDGLQREGQVSPGVVW